jgi:hypothetical protein
VTSLRWLQVNDVDERPRREPSPHQRANTSQNTAVKMALISRDPRQPILLEKKANMPSGVPEPARIRPVADCLHCEGCHLTVSSLAGKAAELPASDDLPMRWSAISGLSERRASLA